jgi:hypothetical protein
MRESRQLATRTPSAPANSGLFHRHFHPIRLHLRPQPLWRIATAADVDLDLLRRFPNMIAELNVCHVDVLVGPGRPGRGWNGWTVEQMGLEDTVAARVLGEA